MQIYNRDFSEQSNRPFVEPSRPLGSALTQTLNRELHIPEGESQADDPAAATCLGMGDCSWEPRASGMPSCAEGGHRGLGPCAAQGDDPSGITSLENRWRSPKLWVTAMSRVTTVPRALGIRQRESSALRLILFFFLQCRTKEVASSLCKTRSCPVCSRCCATGVQPSSTRLHGSSKPSTAASLLHSRQGPLDGARDWGDPLPSSGDPLPASATLQNGIFPQTG